MARMLPGVAVSVKSPVVVMVKVRLAVPRDVVTVKGPVLVPIGTVVVTDVGVTVRTTAATPLNAAWVAPASKPSPLIVTNVPIVPAAGSIDVMVGPRRTVNVRDAGVGSSLPARSRALTSNVCDPAASPVSVAVVAKLNEVNAPLSTRHANTRFAAGVRLSVPVKMKLAVVAAVSPLGPLVI